MKFIVKNTSLKSLKTDLLVVGIFKNNKINIALDKLFNNAVSKAINIDNFKGDFKKSINLYGKDICRLKIVGLGSKKDFSSDKSRSLFADIVRDAKINKIKKLTIDGDSFNLVDGEYAQSCSEGLILGEYEFTVYKSKKSTKNSLSTIEIIGNCNKKDFDKGKEISLSVNYARDLGNHPPNILTPIYLANESKEISKSDNMKINITDIKDFKKMGLRSFYGVAMGSAEPAKMIIVEYNGGKKNDKPLALVGKGLTFDSGGISIKPSPRMDEMKFDMCGGATVMGVMKAVSKLQPKLNIIFAIGATENMPGSRAQRPGDIVTAYNGKTIEVLNTDAEGRLVLADVLSYVNDNYKPSSIIDFATLTGAVLVALGDRASGIMGNNKKLIKEVEKSSEITGEPVWELPMWKEYSKDIKSQIADIKNLGRGRLAGTIAAGAFLKEFVENTPWVHMDIAGTAWGPKEPSYMPKCGATGVAVRLIYNLIENRIK